MGDICQYEINFDGAQYRDQVHMDGLNYRGA